MSDNRKRHIAHQTGRAADIFARYGAVSAPIPAGTQSAAGRYAALEINTAEGTQSWLRLHRDNGVIHLLPYAAVCHAIYAPPGWIVLECESYMVTIVGRNLLPAIALLQSCELAAIYCVGSDKLDEAQEDQPVVLRLLVQTYEEAFAETENTASGALSAPG